MPENLTNAVQRLQAELGKARGTEQNLLAGMESYVSEIRQLKAELAQARELVAGIASQKGLLHADLARAEIERDRALAVVEAVREIVPVSERALLPVYLRPLCDVLAAFDAKQDGKP